MSGAPRTDPDVRFSRIRFLDCTRVRASEQKLLGCFLALSPKAEAYYQALAKRRLNPCHHVQKMVALSEIYGSEAVARAMQDAFTFQAFSWEYIANLFESRKRLRPEPPRAHYPAADHRQDLLELEMSEPDLTIDESPRRRRRRRRCEHVKDPRRRSNSMRSSPI